ncbi:unnamed protein product [Prorocentrum cordatum]|uniref:Uncharacterized protein n=1 Tax=Prorocentrum cordatum TaxID=2364126 RepID=A0ABN9PYS5_9DINO|nr:unnamed protein product [Polarella glacialis]
MEYNSRTSNPIVKWFHNFGVLMLHHRVLRSVFQSAWREKHHPDSAFANHFRALRMYHPREWWGGARQLPYKWGRAHGAAQRVVSHPVAWEDVFCAVYGEQWRLVRDSCPSCQVRRANLECFANAVCQAFGLPELPARVASTPDSCLPPRAKKARSSHVLEDCPAQHSLADADRHVEWGGLKRRLAFVVDCQPAQRIPMGLLLLSDPASEQIFTGICDNFGQVY